MLAGLQHCNIVVIILATYCVMFFLNAYFCPVKKILLIFSIYLLVLPAMACAEIGGCAEEEQYCFNAADDCEDEERSDCGSFCACSCCVHIVSVNFQSPETTVEKILEKNTLLCFYDNISIPSNYFGNIWQPPRVSS